MNKNKNTQKGFSLIEIMVTVAILGIVSAIALPSYTAHVVKGKRTEAKVELLRIAQMQESYFTQNLSYAKDLIQLGFGTNTIDTEKRLYDVTISGISPAGCNPAAAPPIACTAYHITALADAAEAQSGDTVCSGLRIDNVARKWARGIDGKVSVTTLPSAIAPLVAVTPDHTTKSQNCW